MISAIGFAGGVCVCLFIATVLAKRDHREWLKLCDRYEEIIEQLRNQRRDDPADWWRSN